MAKFTSLAVFTLLFGLCEAQTPQPSPFPTLRPTSSPSDAPSMVPSDIPSDSPSKVPSDEPSMLPSLTPSDSPSMVPSDVPSDSPSKVPSDEPSMVPSMEPSDQPSSLPSKEPSRSPSSVPSDQPSQVPSKEPSRSPSNNPTSSIKPSPSPSARPSGPTTSPTAGTKTPTSAPVATCDDTDGYLITLVNTGAKTSCEFVCKTSDPEKLTYRKTTYCDGDPDIASNCCFSCAAGAGCDGNIAPTPTAPTPPTPTPPTPTPPTPTPPTSSCVDDSSHTFTAPFNALQTQNCDYIKNKLCVRGEKFCDIGAEKFISNQRPSCCATCASYDSDCGSTCSDAGGTPITLKFSGTKQACSWLTKNNKETRQGNYCLSDGSTYDVADSCCASCNA
ncbi:hypothetical protein CTEN210_04566 [Chaetoceros tenuissimus]|uniref:Uncharacterized protein n=1 Tax=Chaetoceros tenuissimus TaxID=426638 RepID=A0AAD3CNV3_9STRA|nr:hypothetical protein CTEN210_04566 [Chaetoceros tenuissimus]